jgi:hypothetical protein
MSENYSETPKENRVNAPKASYQTPSMDQNFSGDRYDYESPPPVDQSTLPKSVMGRPVTEDGTWNVPRVSPPVARFGPDAPQGQAVTVNDPTPIGPPTAAQAKATGDAATATDTGAAADEANQSAPTIDYSRSLSTAPMSPTIQPIIPNSERVAQAGKGMPGSVDGKGMVRQEKANYEVERSAREAKRARELRHGKNSYDYISVEPPVRGGMGRSGLVLAAETRKLPPPLAGEEEERDEVITPDKVSDEDLRKSFAASKLEEMGATPDEKTGKVSVPYSQLVKELGEERAKTLASGAIPDRSGNVNVDGETLKRDLGVKVFMTLMEKPDYSFTDTNGYNFRVENGVLRVKYRVKISAAQREVATYGAARDIARQQAEEESKLELHEGMQRSIILDMDRAKAEEDQKLIAEGRAELLERKNEVDKAFRAFMEAPSIDPNGYWNRKNTGGKIGAALMAIGMGFLGGKEGVKEIQATIDRDVDAQKANLERLGQRVKAAQGLYATTKQFMEDDKSARDMAHVIALTQVKRENEEFMWTLKGNSRALERSYKLNVELEQAIMDRKIAIASKTGPAVSQSLKIAGSSGTGGGGGGGGTGGGGSGGKGKVTWDQAKWLIEKLPPHMQAKAWEAYRTKGEVPILKENARSPNYRVGVGEPYPGMEKEASQVAASNRLALNAIAHFGNVYTSTGKIMPQDRARVDAAAAGLVGVYKQLMQGGAYDKGLADLLARIIPGIGDAPETVANYLFKTGQAKLDELMTTIRNYTVSAATSVSQNPEPDEVWFNPNTKEYEVRSYGEED